MNARRMAAGALLIGLALLAYSFIPGHGPQETVLPHSQLLLEDPNAAITAVSGRLLAAPDAKEQTLQFAREESNKRVRVDLTPLPAGWYLVSVTRGDTAETLELQVLEEQVGFLGALGAALAVLAAPWVLIPSSRLVTTVKGRKAPLAGWVYLLMEPTGLSLARLQLVILFVPAAVAYLALSFTTHEFPIMPDSVWHLLGIGGATAALSTLLTPGSQVPSTISLPGLGSFEVARAAEEQAAAVQVAAPVAMPVSQAPATTEEVMVKPPHASDLFEEVNGYGDISRYQSLVMCVATAVVFIVHFFDGWSVPEIPEEVLQLLGMSLAVYLGVKGIKLVKKQNNSPGA
ncbi:MAG TPA: hypothetical protein VD902_17995 [Symbiobacteriaceae bacterium]|nr:hypothetical protein [Symbiobacteriaceae bacterium]